jgi:D-glycero-D-manno-heptose 1,7-bisphosphate phosphatase
MNKVVVLDRDGTLIKHIPYLHDSNNVILLPGVKSGIKKLLNSNIKIYIHTNQSGINRGYFNYDDAIQCNNVMINLLEIKKSEIASVCIAPETPDQISAYRKPSPKFGNDIISKLGITTNELFYIGDSICDLETANNIGCKGVGVNTGIKDLNKEIKHSNSELLKYPVFESFTDAVLFVINE